MVSCELFEKKPMIQRAMFFVENTQYSVYTLTAMKYLL